MGLCPRVGHFPPWTRSHRKTGLQNPSTHGFGIHVRCGHSVRSVRPAVVDDFPDVVFDCVTDGFDLVSTRGTGTGEFWGA
ncbi:hypothetical protein GCM10010185_62020 [Saccharothrix coeruleofusca]|uniref:Uncharacterized protein n=1 Tax=Saccharothrix coeruleofusca TaxID=33919 RepID=A0A918EGA8_9PSEU|nr:hypothetical protein GCM10010185_62020 [Saccharothrix coeruleofusca]